MNKVFEILKKKFKNGYKGWLIVDDEKDFLVYYHKASKSGIVFENTNGNKYTITAGRMFKEGNQFDFEYVIFDEDDGFFSEKEMIQNIIPVIDELFIPAKGTPWKNNKIPYKENIAGGKRKPGRRAIEVNVDYSGIDFTLHFNTGIVSGPIHYVGTREEFAKFLQKIQAKDSLTKPRMTRQITYKEIVDNIIQQKDTKIWVWSTVLEKIKGTVFNKNTMSDLFKENYNVGSKKDNYFKGL